MSATSLQDLYVQKLYLLLDAEQQAMEAMPRLTEQVQSPQLRTALEQHQRQTEQQVRRLEQLMQNHEEPEEQNECISMSALIEEAESMLPDIEDPDAIDAFLIGCAQAMEHHEIAAYGTARTWAAQLGHTDDVRILQQTLDEEGQADKMLTSIAESSVNREAAQGTDREVSMNRGSQGDRMPAGESRGGSSGSRTRDIGGEQNAR
jgi:ferritin-like metal-binding protein YciE